MGLPWIEVDVSLPRHRKSLLLGRLLEDERAWAYAAQFWLWCAETCPEGQVMGANAIDVVELAAGWRGARGALVSAFITAGFLDEIEGGLEAHGWPERASAHLAKREKDAKRAKERREKTATRFAPKDVARTSRGRPSDVVEESTDVRVNRNPNPKPNPNPDLKEEEAPPPLPVGSASTPRPTPDRLSGAGFFAYTQEKRLEVGLATETPPHPSKLSRWYSEAMSEMNGDDDRLREAYLIFGDDPHWQKQKPPLPINAFLKLWRDFVPQKQTDAA